MANVPILLVGSVPLRSAAQVFEVIARDLAGLVKRIPDGETGERLNFIVWAGEQIGKAKGMEVNPDETGPAWTNGKVFRCKQQVTSAQIDFGPHIYADAALKSYEDFKRLRAEKKIPLGVRFQVSLPTAMAVIFSHTSPPSRPTVWAAYERHFLDDVRKIVASIPSEDLAIQWDFATEIDRILEIPDVAPNFSMQSLIDSVARLSEPIPEDVELGIHLCYGDPGHKHIIEPKDTALMVEVSNRLARTVRRRIDWIHIPVPKERDDYPYFSPLHNLRLDSSTELYLGVIHLSDGVAGAKRRIQAAHTVVPKFGVATECGWGRRASETIPELLTLHRQVAQITP